MAFPHHQTVLTWKLKKKSLSLRVSPSLSAVPLLTSSFLPQSAAITVCVVAADSFFSPFLRSTDSVSFPLHLRFLSLSLDYSLSLYVQTPSLIDGFTANLCRRPRLGLPLSRSQQLPSPPRFLSLLLGLSGPPHFPLSFFSFRSGGSATAAAVANAAHPQPPPSTTDPQPTQASYSVSFPSDLSLSPPPQRIRQISCRPSDSTTTQPPSASIPSRSTIPRSVLLLPSASIARGRPSLFPDHVLFLDGERKKW